MNKITKISFILVCSALLLISACTKVLITGRKQFNIIPAKIMLSMSITNYNSFLSENELSDNVVKSQLVERVGRKVSAAVDTYLEQNNLSEEFGSIEWEFKLVKDDAVNAWAMPGGKIVIYTGILKVTENEAGLATVMSHEIAHVIAKHGSERMTQALMIEMGGLVLQKALEEKPEKTQELFVISYNIGAALTMILPHSRVQENEADHLGLIFMAMSGYDPHEAVDFWQRMADEKKEKDKPMWQFLSTHPTDEIRIENIKSLIPEAMTYAPRGEGQADPVDKKDTE